MGKCPPEKYFLTVNWPQRIAYIFRCIILSIILIDWQKKSVLHSVRAINCFISGDLIIKMFSAIQKLFPHQIIGTVLFVAVLLVLKTEAPANAAADRNGIEATG